MILGYGELAQFKYIITEWSIVFFVFFSDEETPRRLANECE